MKNVFAATATLALTIVMLLSYSSPSSAQDQAQRKPFQFEITPLAGYRMGGEFEEEGGSVDLEIQDSNALGIVFNIRANENGQYEVLLGRQETEVDTGGLFSGDPLVDLDVSYYQFGGTYLFDGDKARPFIAMTFGVTNFDPQPSEYSTENYFSASFGGGVQLNSSERFGIRLEGRVYGTFLEDDSSIFCQSIGGDASCLIQVDAKVLTQWEARAGLVYRF